MCGDIEKIDFKDKAMNIKTEEMAEKHIKRLAEIEKQIFGADNAEKTLLKELENKISVYYAAYDDNDESRTAVGYVGIWNICGEVDIINIAVIPECRRQGVAYRLFERVLDYCRENNVTAINLEVRESNTAAQSLYKKLGFLTVGERKRYYDGVETAVLMRKELA